VDDYSLTKAGRGNQSSSGSRLLFAGVNHKKVLEGVAKKKEAGEHTNKVREMKIECQRARLDCEKTSGNGLTRGGESWGTSTQVAFFDHKADQKDKGGVYHKR